MKFLLDANLSPETADFLRRLSFNAKSLIEMRRGGLDDSGVMQLAKKEKRILITFDLDFGEIAYFSELEHLGVIVLRLTDQRIESVNSVLGSFLKKCKSASTPINLFKKLTILEEGRFRISPL